MDMPGNNQNETVEKKKAGLVGMVIHSGRNKTAKILIEKYVKHRRYGKYIKRSMIVHAHDEANVCREGNLVSITGCKRYSKTKAWIVTEVLK